MASSTPENVNQTTSAVVSQDNSSNSIGPMEIFALVNAEVDRRIATQGVLSKPVPKPDNPRIAKVWDHSVDVKDKIQRAMIELQREEPDPQKIQELLSGAVSTLDYRLKLLKIADKHGWGAVNAYEGGEEIGDNEEDAKRIRLAVAQAEKDRERKRADSLRQKRRFNTPPNMVRPMAPGTSSGYGTSWGSHMPNVWPFRNPAPFWGPRLPTQTQAVSPPAPICYSCWTEGHFSKFCPYKPVPTGEKK